MPGAENWTMLLPEIALVVGRVVLLLMDAAVPRQRGVHLAFVRFAAILVSAELAVSQWGKPPNFGLAGMVVQDRFGVFARLVILFAAALATLIAPGYLRPRAARPGRVLRAAPAVDGGHDAAVGVERPRDDLPRRSSCSRSRST